MPLTKLFQRRNSSQKDRKKSLTSAELSASDSTAETSSANKLDQTQIASSSESFYSDGKRKSSAGLEENQGDESSDIQPELENRNDETHGSSATSRRCSVPETLSDIKEHVRNKSRSLSLKDSGTKPNLQKTRRRKCESESAAFSSTDDEGFEDKVIQLRERDLEKVIGQCVDRLIRESILTAVKSVNVDSLYEDVIKSLSRSASESSASSGGPETVQQKLHSDSVTEYADLQMVHTFEEEKLEGEELDETDDSKQQRDSDVTSTESFETPEPDKCLNTVIPAETNANDSAKSAQDCASSIEKQNGKTLSEDQVADSKQLDTIIESDAVTVEDKELQESDVCEERNETKQQQESSVLTKSQNETEQNETVNNAVDISSQDPAPQKEGAEEVRDELLDEADFSKIEAEEAKDTSTDGYRADIEESVSIHSMASESSFENIVDPKVDSRTISDDTVDSMDKVSLGEQLDTTLKKDNNESTKEQLEKVKTSKKLGVDTDLMAMSGDDFSQLLTPSEPAVEDPSVPASDLGENLPEQKPAEEEKKVNWKVGYLHVKLPHKSRYKGLKVWKKRCVAIQPDEFANDDSDHCLVLSVYSGDSSAAKKHSASFWKSISCQKAVIYRSSSRTHPYSFTISDDKKAVIHLATDSEAISQEWMAAIRAILWPPSPVVQLEKMLNGREFEISIIDSEFSYHAGLLGMYGYLTITPKKLILVHPQQGYVIQEWYLNTIDKFQLMQQTRIEDVNKVLSMTTCSDSSTGKGDIMIFCKEAVALLQAIASTIHQILSHHSKQEGGKYQKELEEIGEWLVADSTATEDYYKVPPRQVKSLLDIPNFIFNMPLTPVSGTPGAPVESQKSKLDVPKDNATMASQDSDNSSEAVSDDFLNCSTTSFVVGRGAFPGKSSDSELSDNYTPPRSPEVRSKREVQASKVKANT